MDGVLKWVGLGLWPGIVEIAGGQRISFRESLVDAARGVILVGDGRQRHAEGLRGSIAIDRRSCRSLGPELQIGCDRGNSHRALRVGWDADDLGGGPILADTFVSSIDESLVLYDCGATRATELDAPEGWN